MGSDGVINVSFTELSLNRTGIVQPSRNDVLKGYNSVATFANAMQQELGESLRLDPPLAKATSDKSWPEKYVVPRGYDGRYDHFVNFSTAIREQKPVYENATFGLRAAAPALLCNDSLRLGKVLSCDPVNRKTWSCGHPPAMPGGCPKSAAVPCSCRPITGRWHSGTFAFDRWSDVRSGYMLLFGAEEASPKVWYPRNVNGPIRPTGICLLTVQHEAGGGDCRAEEMVSNVFHDFGPLVATEPA